MKRLTYLAATAIMATSTLPIAAQQPATVPQTRVDLPRVVTRTPTTRFVTIEGYALRTMRGANAAKAAVALAADPAAVPDGDRVPNILVRLRDARYGRAVDSQLTDGSGAFLFRAVEPGNYLVEVVGVNQNAISTTQLISANAGETISTVVRLPGLPPTFASLFGQQTVAPVAVTQSGVSSLVSGVLEQLPLAVAQSLPAVVAVDPASSER